MKHYDYFTTFATKYGLTMKLLESKDYVSWVRNNHQGLNVTETVLFVPKEFPFLEASPDGLVHYTWKKVYVMEECS